MRAQPQNQVKTEASNTHPEWTEPGLLYIPMVVEPCVPVGLPTVGVGWVSLSDSNLHCCCSIQP